jgi:beta-N-acetylhexosaminidase
MTNLQIKRQISDLTSEEKAGQLFVIGFNGTSMNNYIKEIITKWKIGGVVFSIRNVENTIQVKELIGEMQDLAMQEIGIPLTVTINQEGGDRTCFLESLSHNPGNMAIGATHNPHWAYEVAKLVGTELRALGFNMLYMPVLDFSIVPEKEVLGIRSFGDETELVSNMGVNYIRGLNEAGLASTGKHFPGGGASEKDAHFELPFIDKSLDEMESYELKPFRKAVEAGVSSIMIAHIDYRKLDNGIIATMSEKIINGILRERLGFDGIVTSDAFGMHGLIDHADPREACVKAILAGGDVILKRHGREANLTILQSLIAAVKSGKISNQRVDGSLKRILSVKNKFCGGPQPEISEAIWNKKHISTLESMGKESVTLLRNSENLLPLKIDQQTRVLLIMPDMIANASLDGTFGDQAGYIIRSILSEKFSYSTDGIDLIHYGLKPYEKEIESVINKAGTYDVLILGSHRSHLRPGQAEMIKNLFKLKKKIIWVALNIPYDLLVYPEATTYICTYSERLPQLKALCNIISGEISPKGKLPVRLKDLHNFCDGITGFNKPESLTAENILYSYK